MLHIQHPDFQKILQLIATNEYENIALAISIAPSIEIDIVKAVSPFLETNPIDTSFNYTFSNDPKNPYYLPVKKWEIEKKICYLLQQSTLTLPAYSDASLFEGLVFCQNVEILTIDMQCKELLTDFEHCKFNHLILRACENWVLSPGAIENLNKQDLQILDIAGASSSEKPDKQGFIIPKELGNLQSLRELSIDHNLLKSVPEELLNLTQLTQLNIYSLQKDIQIPDKLFSLPHLSFVSLNYIPDNTFPYLSRTVRFNIARPSFISFFKLVAWKKDFATYWNPIFKDNAAYFFSIILQILHFPIYLFGSNAKSKTGYYFRVSIFGILLFLLSPIFVIYIIIKSWGSLPNLYIRYTKKRSGLVYNLAQKATPRPSSIEGIGPMGCLGGIFLLVLFFFQDYFLAMICRYLFLPLAIVLTPVDWVLGLMGKLLRLK